MELARVFARTTERHGRKRLAGTSMPAIALKAKVLSKETAPVAKLHQTPV